MGSRSPGAEKQTGCAISFHLEDVEIDLQTKSVQPTGKAEACTLEILMSV